MNLVITFNFISTMNIKTLANDFMLSHQANILIYHKNGKSFYSYAKENIIIISQLYVKRKKEQ